MNEDRDKIMNEFVFYGFLKGIKNGNELEIKSIRQLSTNGDYSKGYLEGKTSVLIDQNRVIKNFMRGCSIKL